MHLVQDGGYRTLGYNDLSSWIYKSQFFLEAYKLSETKAFFPLKMVWSPFKDVDYRTSPYSAFYSKLCSWSRMLGIGVFGDKWSDNRTCFCQNETISVLLPTGVEKYPYLQKIGMQERMTSFRGLVPILETMQKMMAFRTTDILTS